MSVESVQELLVEELRDLYDAEKQLTKSLPKMAKAATNSELRDAFKEHLEVTKGQVQRLEQVFELLGARAKSKPCKAMKGLVEEGQEIIGEDMEDSLHDAAIIGAASKVEHYEMAGYTSARMLALQVGNKEAAQLLEETLREETDTAKRLMSLSKALLKEAGRMKSDVEEVPMRGRGGKQQAKRGSNGGGNGSRGNGQAKRGGSSSGKSRSRGGNSEESEGGHSAQPLTDHDEIRQWAEERGAKPACVRKTGGKGDIGMIRLDFPGYSGENSLEEITWEEFFEKFDESELALIVQETTASGEKSNFNKLVSRETAEK